MQKLILLIEENRVYFKVRKEHEKDQIANDIQTSDVYVQHINLKQVQSQEFESIAFYDESSPITQVFIITKF